MVSFLVSSWRSLGCAVVVVMVVVLLLRCVTPWSISLSLSPSGFTDFFHFSFQISTPRALQFLFCGCNISSYHAWRSSIAKGLAEFVLLLSVWSPVCLGSFSFSLFCLFHVGSIDLPSAFFFIHRREAGGSPMWGWPHDLLNLTVGLWEEVAILSSDLHKSV